MDKWEQSKKEIRELENDPSISNESVRLMSSASLTHYWRQRLDEDRSLWENRLRNKEDELKGLKEKLQGKELLIKELQLNLDFSQREKNQVNNLWEEKIHTRDVENQLLRERMEWEARFRTVWETEIKKRDDHDHEENAGLKNQIQDMQKNHFAMTQESIQLRSQLTQEQQSRQLLQSENQRLKDEKDPLIQKRTELEMALKNTLQEKEDLLARIRDIEQGGKLSQTETRSAPSAPPFPPTHTDSGTPSQYKKLILSQHQSHLEMVEDLARGFSHRVRNLLGIMSGTVQICLTEPKLSEEMKSQLSIVNENGDELLQVVEEFLSLSRIPQLNITPIDLNDFLRSTLLAMEDKAKAQNIILTMDFHKDLSPIQGETTHLGEVVSHIMKNAIEAMPNGGDLTVTTTPHPDGGAIVRFKDTGKGIKDAHIKKVYQMYFSTKKNRRGLGLSLVQRVMDLHHGNVKLESTPGKGTTIALEFPSYQ